MGARLALYCQRTVMADYQWWQFGLQSVTDPCGPKPAYRSSVPIIAQTGFPRAVLLGALCAAGHDRCPELVEHTTARIAAYAHNVARDAERKSSAQMPKRLHAFAD